MLIKPDIEPWFAGDLEISNSSIHGQGLFSKKTFSPGCDILRLGGFFFCASARRSENVMRSTATFLSEEVILAEPSHGGRDFSDYLNHSCDPNLGLRDATSIVAIRSISEGEELVIDYTFWEGDLTWKLKNACTCGGQHCRKHVTGVDWKIVRPTDDRFQYFSPFLKRRILSIEQKGNENELR